MSRLYVVPTPIGNLEDITLRALRILKEADLILAEDTRTSRILLDHYQIRKPLLSHHKFNEHKTVHSIVQRILSGETIALVSDAGTPGISDPGYLLVHACIEQGIPVEILPGPSALIPAVVGSGLPCERFVFEGFLPFKKGRQTRLNRLKEEERTIILYESPHRLARTLSDLSAFLGNHRKAVVVREISKKFEEFNRGTLGELLAFYQQNTAKGEIVIVVQGADG
ncbi:MAG: 16S rRNA (cytidine(1402)-2'-O)-methyltransferase [Bacteroidales bacterium]|jgi:16S rRNA (cytidine1402-2'-O)-methyltransferase|nr:16S rRNA (cytidine(1402)-2'-O)-methyltransferase [Bacteroidales bacterium]